MTEGYVLSAMVMGVLLLTGAAILSVGGRFAGLAPPKGSDSNWLDHVQSSSEWRLVVAVAVVVVGGGAIVAFAGESLGLPDSIVTTAEFIVTGIVLVALLAGLTVVLRALLGRFDVTTAGTVAVAAVFVGIVLALLITLQLDVEPSAVLEEMGL